MREGKGFLQTKEFSYKGNFHLNNFEGEGKLKYHEPSVKL